MPKKRFNLASDLDVQRFNGSYSLSDALTPDHAHEEDAHTRGFLRAVVAVATLFGLSVATSGQSPDAVRASEQATADKQVQESSTDCSAWMLDGYRLGMRGDEILAVRSVTLHVAGQAQAGERGKFQGVLVLDALNRLEKWDVKYRTRSGDALRAQLRERFGEPISDVVGNILENGTDTIRQRRTCWQSVSCDVAIVVSDNVSVRGGEGHSISACLARASSFPKGLLESRSLSP